MSDFETFLRWEERSRDTIDFKKAYVDMAGDVIAGLMLSQIIYWHLPGQAGKTRLRVERDRRLWLVKSRDEWWEECRLTPREVDRARKVLEARGLVEVKLYKFNGSPTQHIRIREPEFVKAWHVVVQDKTKHERKGGGGGGEAEGAGEKPAVVAVEGAGACGRNAVKEIAGLSANSLKSPFSPNGEMDFTDSLNAFDGNRKMDFTKRLNPITETTTEITAAAAREPPASDAAAGLLVEELVGHGVGRTVAKRLAGEKSDVCRQYLEYLPFAKLRTTKGAWLANAIRDEYGPPQRYLDAKRKEGEEADRRKAADAEKSRISQEEALRQKKIARLRETLSQVEKQQGEALAAFTEYVKRERARVAKVLVHLTPERREEQLASFDSTERRLELFEQWAVRQKERRRGRNLGRNSEAEGYVDDVLGLLG